MTDEIKLKEVVRPKQRLVRYFLEREAQIKLGDPHKINMAFLIEKARERGFYDTELTPDLDKAEKLWVPLTKESTSKYLQYKIDYYSWGDCNNQTCPTDYPGYGLHRITSAGIEEYATRGLKMVKPSFNDSNIYRVEVEKIVKKIVEKKVEVEKIVEKEVIKIKEVEIPVALSFEQREMVTNMCHREQHIINEALRLAMIDNSPERASVLLGRLEALKAYMRIYEIPLDSYENGKVWLMGVDFSDPYMNKDGQLLMSPTLEN